MSDNRFDYSKYRYEKAKEDLDAAKKNLQDGFYTAANNRAYYSVFHSMRSILNIFWFDDKSEYENEVSEISLEVAKLHVLDGRNWLYSKWLF